jgi:predicted RNA-binding protein with RPS1 domain
MTTFSRFQEQPQDNRKRVMRMAILYTPITVISLALVCLALFKIATGYGGFIVMLLFFGTLALLTGFQTVGYLKDLKSKPIEYQGEVVRKWHKGNLLIFFMPSYYVAVDSQSHTGRITRVEDHGCFVTMHHGAEGYLPLKEMEVEPGIEPTQHVSMGSEIRYKVLGVDKRGGYKLSQRRVEEGEYITKLFTVSHKEYAALLEKDLVKVTCYPHSNTVERVHRYDEVEKEFVPAGHGAEY